MTEDIFLKPPAHGRITKWLGPQMVGRLLHFAQTRRDHLRSSGISTDDGARIDLTYRRSYRINGLGELRNQLQMELRAALLEICRELGTGRFEPSEFEIEMIVHGDGAFFTEHCDRNIQRHANRRHISAVYYFHRLPKSFSGGALRIYPLAGRAKSNAFVEIEPVNDTLVFFPSWFPHEVLPVHCPSGQFEDSRFAINCWIHS